MLSPKRDLVAANLFLRLALWGRPELRPRVINADGHPAYARATEELKQSGELGRRCHCRTAACGPFERFDQEFILCRECGGRSDVSDWESTSGGESHDK